MVREEGAWDEVATIHSVSNELFSNFLFFDELGAGLLHQPPSWSTR